MGARIVQGIGAALMVPQVLTGTELHFKGAAHSTGWLIIVLGIAGIGYGAVFSGVLAHLAQSAGPW